VHKPWNLPSLDALAPVAVGALVLLLARGCGLSNPVRLPLASSSAAGSTLLQGERVGEEYGDVGASGGGSGGTSGWGGVRFLPAPVCAFAQGALGAAAVSPHALGAQRSYFFSPLISLLLLWRFTRAYLRGSLAVPASSGGGLLAQLPGLAAILRVLWDAMGDLGTVLVVLGVAACLGV
jgi:hypothetical protein